jgi:hypothetical protein
MIHYAAFDSHGEILDVGSDLDSVVDVAASTRGVVQVQDIEEDTAFNPAVAPERARKATGLPVTDENVLRIPIKEAHEALMPYFEGLSARRGSEVKTYRKPGGMIKAWIGQNYKTSKEHPENPSKVMGLTLVPHSLVKQIGEKPEIYGEQYLARVASETPRLPRGFTLCAGSNQLCRDSCLVYAGQNAAALYNTQRKVQQTLALLNEPEAFMRILASAIAQHECTAPTEGYAPYMRLNVLSDIPWEIVAPWLFERFGHLQFYDYTKVPGRQVPRNYDLTFSFSGTNLRQTQSEIKAGSKIAVVFLANRKRGGRWEAWKRARGAIKIPLPNTFWGLPVVDGDVSDVRPLDPSPSVVGLRWKPVSGRRVGRVIDPNDPDMKFVTPVYVVGGEGVLEKPGARLNPNEDQWLVSAVTPRFQPIRHTVGQTE